jgi:hypothetical protein
MVWIPLGIACLYLLLRLLRARAQPPTVAPPDVVPAPAPPESAVHREMLSDFQKTARALEREVAALGPTDPVLTESVVYTRAAENVRTLVGRLQLLLPSLQAGTFVHPDLARAAARTRSLNQQAEAAPLLPLPEHWQALVKAVAAALTTLHTGLAALAPRTGSAPTAESERAAQALPDALDQAQLASQMLWLAARRA